MKKFLALVVALTLLPQMAFGFSLPPGAEILTSPDQISEYKILGQVGKSGEPGSYLYGTRLLGGFSNPTSSGGTAPVTINEVATQVITPAGLNTITNGSFLSNYTGWTTSSIIGADFTITSTAYDGDSKAAQISVTVETQTQGPPAGLLSQSDGSYTAGKRLNAGFAYRASNDSSTSTTLNVVISNANLQGGFTQLYNLQTGVWDTTTTIGQEYSIPFEVNNQQGPDLSTSTYALIDWETLVGQQNVLPLTAPPTGNITLSFRIDGKVSDKVLIDGVYINSVAYVTETPIDVSLFNYKSTASSLTANSTFCFVNTSDSNCIFGLAYNHPSNSVYLSNGDLETVLNLTETGGVFVPTSTQPFGAVNKLNSISILGDPVFVDFEVVASTTLYTVPMGYSAYIEQFDTDLTLDTYTVGWIGSIGTNDPDWSNFNTWSAGAQTLWGTPFVSLQAGGGVGSIQGHAKYLEGSVVKINITTGATATTLSGLVRTIGYLIKN